MGYLLYFFIALTATGAGAMTGMGGGVIIKPLLDLLGDLPAADIGVLSSITVFAMALVSAGMQLRKKVANLKMTVPLAVGSLLGGTMGDRLLTTIIEIIRVNRLVVVLQNICLATVILAVFAYMRMGERRPVLGVRGIVPAALAGMFLGTISSFLGIGGGPINVALILFVFACDIKAATACSILVILFAQASKLASALLSGIFFSHNLSMLPAMAAGAVLGGCLGTCLNQRLPDRVAERVFASVQALVLLVCLCNILCNLFP